MTSLEKRIKEIAVLVTAKYWSSEYEWALHSKIGISAGLSKEFVDAIGRGEVPSGMKPDETAAHQFCVELNEKKRVSDRTFEIAVGEFGEAGVVNLVGMCGYYTLVAMILNVGEVPAPEPAR